MTGANIMVFPVQRRGGSDPRRFALVTIDLRWREAGGGGAEWW